MSTCTVCGNHLFTLGAAITCSKCGTEYGFSLIQLDPLGDAARKLDHMRADHQWQLAYDAWLWGEECENT